MWYRITWDESAGCPPVTQDWAFDWVAFDLADEEGWDQGCVVGWVIPVTAHSDALHEPMGPELWPLLADLAIHPISGEESNVTLVPMLGPGNTSLGNEEV